MNNNEIKKQSIDQSYILIKTAQICFWTHIARLLSSDMGIPLSILFSGIHVFCMVRMGFIDLHFRTAGLIEAVAIAARLLIPTLSAGFWDVLRDVGIHGLNLLWTYYEFTGFYKALAEFDQQISDKWRSTRNWYLGAKAVVNIGVSFFSFAEFLPKLIMVLAIFISFFMEISLCSNYWKTAKIGKT